MARGVSSPNALRALGSPSRDAPLCVLDSWVWIRLSAARTDPADPLRAAWERLAAATADGVLQIALTSGNYLELWNREKAASRHKIATTMAQLTDYVSLRAMHEVVIEETRRLIARRRAGARGPAATIEREWVLGVGAQHAFGSPSGRFRFVETIATKETPEGAPTEMPKAWPVKGETMTSEAFEWFNLAGLDDSYNIPGIDYRPTHRQGDEWVDAQNFLHRKVAFIDSDPSLLYRMLIDTRLQDVFEQVGPTAVSGEELRAWFTGPIDGVAFVTALPVQQVYAELLFAAHRNLNYKFRQHDRVDIMELALTVPYCDVVVPDKNWAHLANASRVAREHNTTVLQGLRAFKEWAERL